MAMVCRAHIMLERQILLPGWCLLLLAATAHKCSANLGCEAQQRGWAGADSSAGIGNVAGKDLELLRSKCRAAAVPHTQMCAKFHYFNALIMAALSLFHFATLWNSLKIGKLCMQSSTAGHHCSLWDLALLGHSMQMTMSQDWGTLGFQAKPL